MVITLQQAIGAKVRSARVSHGLTQEQLAERIGCAWETISKIERGRNPPSVKTLHDIAATLNLSVDGLMGNAGREVSRTRLDYENQAMDILHRLSDADLATAIQLLDVLGERGKG